MNRNTYHRDGTVTYWSVYEQIWRRLPAAEISDQTLATMSASERRRIERIATLGPSNLEA